MIRKETIMLLEETYKKLITEYGFETRDDEANVSGMIRDALSAFLAGCQKPAIWCYGEHTRMLMADFMNELRQVKFIIDEHAREYSGDAGFQMICSEEAGSYGIDGIVISSFKYRNEIRDRIEREYPSVPYLDIYDYFEEHGVFLRKEYYLSSHPYNKYAKISRLKTLLKEETDGGKKEKLYLEIIKSFVEIKDFRLAAVCADALCHCAGSRRQERLTVKPPYREKYAELPRKLRELYEMECEAAGQIDGSNVLMLCLDGMRDKDISSGAMPGLQAFVRDECYRYDNAYAVSTSTYESLIPAYGEIPDMRTKYYERNCVAEEECRFIRKAKQQGRNIYFYTDFVKYVDAEGIIRKEGYETATEKIWSFILDAADETNGLFYVHVLYESHYSYPSPYAGEGLVAEGTNILFDFLSRHSGRLRTDYEGQHRDALGYLDDTLVPFLERMKGRMLVYADHGNIIFGQDTELEEIPPLSFTYHDDLLHIPLIIRSSEMGACVDHKNISLMEINEILVCLMEGRRFIPAQPDIVKAQRSAIYNPDFQYLYRKCGQEQGLKAFEAFLFEDHSKLAVYEDGHMELSEDDAVTDNEEKRRELFERVKDRVTVCDSSGITV